VGSRNLPTDPCRCQRFILTACERPGSARSEHASKLVIKGLPCHDINNRHMKTCSLTSACAPHIRGATAQATGRQGFISEGRDCFSPLLQSASEEGNTLANLSAPTAKIIRIAHTNPASRKPASRGSSKPYNDKDRKKRTPQWRAKAETAQKTKNRLFSSRFTLRIDTL
jgi:hypothetical protein